MYKTVLEGGSSCVCGMEFDTLEEAIKHRKTAYNPDNHKCEKCERILGSKRRYLDHMVRHGSKRFDDATAEWYKCEKCRKKFLTSESLFDHTKYQHRVRSERSFHGSISDEYYREIQCLQCGADFKTVDDYSDHMAEHGIELSDDATFISPNKCDVCGAGFDTIENSLAHMKDRHNQAPDQPVSTLDENELSE